MLRFNLVLVFCTLILGSQLQGLSAQQNVTLVSQTSIGNSASDIWGYVDSSGTEYAIIGQRCAARVYSLENPAAPQLRADIAGVCTTWRDFKRHNDRIYGVTDGNGSEGILIIDMSGAPHTITHRRYNPDVLINGVTRDLDQCHNLYIDEFGYMYVAGCQPGTRGVIIFDLNTNPDTPAVVQVINDRYVHDVYARDNRVYTSDVFEGDFSVYDVTNKAVPPVLLARQQTGTNFTHNAWLSDDGQTLFTTDEKARAFTEAYDISDLGNISLLDRHVPLASAGTPTIPHNVHVHNDYLVTSHYTEGVVIVDASQPDNLIQVGQYDTYAPSVFGFNGAWGAYPFLPSGLLLVSDIQSGLYVLQPNYVRACYLRGTVRDITTNQPIPNVQIDIIAPDLNDGLTDNSGDYATGVVTPGHYQVVFSHPSYGADTVGASLATGVTTRLDHFMGDYTDTCVTDINLSSAASTRAWVANQSITSTALIDSAISVQYQAGDEILLNPGFDVRLGGQLIINNEGCSPSPMTSQPRRLEHSSRPQINTDQRL